MLAGVEEGPRGSEAQIPGVEGNGMGEWCVLATLQGTLHGAPADGVQRRFTSFFAKISLEIDSQAFPERQTVEVRGHETGRGCYPVLFRSVLCSLFFVLCSAV